MKDFNFLKQEFQNKNILHIPIVSSINRDTNNYNLDTDGNIVRMITLYSICNSYNKLYILLPKKLTSENIINKFKSYSSGNIEIIYSEYFGIHAGEQRKKEDIIEGQFNDIKNIINNVDYIVCEGQGIALKLLDDGFKNIIYNNPLITIPTMHRSYTEGYDDIDKELFDKCIYSIITTPAQYKYYKDIDENKCLYLDKFCDRDLPYFSYETDDATLSYLKILKEKYKIYYLPYRLTDEAYKMDMVINMLNNEKEDYRVLYSDPNNSHFVEDNNEIDKSKFIKVSTDKNTYYTILDFNKVVIPYFEDLEYSYHVFVDEVLCDKAHCEILLLKESYLPKFKNNPRFKLYL